MDTHVEEQHKHQVTIIVNTRAHEWDKERITFEEVVKIAYPTPPGQDTVYTVSYTNGPKENSSGTLVKGESVKVKDGMIFSVTATNKS